VNKISVIKKIDSSFGRLIVPMIRRFVSLKKQTGSTISSVLFIRPGGIGDTALLMPAITAFKTAFPQATISVLCEKRNCNVYALCPNITRVYHYDSPMELIAAVRGDYDVVIDTEQWHNLSAIIARLTRAPVLIGFATNKRNMLFTHAVPYSHDSYEVFSFLDLFEPLSAPRLFDSDTPFLDVPQKFMNLVAPFLKLLNGQKIVSLFPGGSIDERKWGGDRFHQVATLLSGQGYSIVVVGGADDFQSGEKIVSSLSGALNLCGKLSLPETTAVLKESTLLITGDSGIMHIGYGLGIKVLALIGPGREQKWAPRGKNCKVINKHLPCSPCTTFGYTQKCKRNAECMKRITVEEVFAASMAMLK
jgi:ADP-heptose:LPS heptosyltransferase